MKLRLCAFADEAARSLDGQIDALTRNGIGLIEVRGIDGKNVSDFTPDEARKYADALRAAGIRPRSLEARNDRLLLRVRGRCLPETLRALHRALVEAKRARGAG